MSREPTYAELRALRAREWADAQARAGEALREQARRILSMPDVTNRPQPGEQWTSKEVLCPNDQAGTFIMRRWTTVNGRRHRTEVECMTCHRVGTWDWTTVTPPGPNGRYVGWL